MIDIMEEVNEDKTKFTLKTNGNGTMTVLKDGYASAGFRYNLVHGYVSNKARPLSEDDMLYLIKPL